MTSWENPVPVAAFLSSTDLENHSQDTPLIEDARSRTYDAVCIPLTTPKWMERWRGMCTVSSEPDKERAEGSELRAETWRANPVFELGEVTMTRLGMSPFHERCVASADGTQWIRGDRRRHSDGVRLARTGCGRQLGQT